MTYTEYKQSDVHVRMLQAAKIMDRTTIADILKEEPNALAYTYAVVLGVYLDCCYEDYCDAKEREEASKNEKLVKEAIIDLVTHDASRFDEYLCSHGLFNLATVGGLGYMGKKEYDDYVLRRYQPNH